MARGRPRKNPKDVLLKSAELFGWALGGIEREIAETRERLALLIAHASKMRQRIGGTPSAVAGPSDESGTPVKKRRRRRMSREARKRISEMMKKRWAERRKARK